MLAMENVLVLDYGMGNIGSVARKLRRVGASPIVSSSRADVLSVSKIILPGVGHFASAVARLKDLGLWDALDKAVTQGNVRILGICLGMQLMANSSEEGNESGFGWIDADVVRFHVKDKFKDKVPHMGWNNVELKKDSPIFKGVDPRPGFYFVHSYHMKCNRQDDVLGVTDYSYPFVSAIQKGNIFGVQFHPEKSHESGERIFYNFTQL